MFRKRSDKRKHTIKAAAAAVTSAAILLGTPIAGLAGEDTSVMKPWINSNIAGVVTEEVTAELKDDFYLNINHDWLTHATFRPGKASESNWNDAEDTVRERCLEILQDKTLTGEDAAAIQAYYELWLDWDARNEAGCGAYLPVLEELLNVQTLDELTRFLLSEENHRYGAFPAQLMMERSMTDASTYDVEITATALLLEDAEEYRELTSNGERKKQAFEEMITYMFDHAELAGDVNAHIQAAEAFEKELAASMLTKEEMLSADAVTLTMHPVTFEELKEKSPAFPLSVYMEKFGWAESSQINLQEPEWLAKLNALYTEENLEGIRSWVLIHMLKTMIRSTDEEAFRRYQEIDNQRTGVTVSLSDEELAYQECRTCFPDKFARIYVDRYLNEEIRSEIRGMCEDVVAVYRDMLAETQWLSQATREKAIEKLDKLAIHAVYPDKWKDDSMYRVVSKEDGGSYIEAVADHREAVWKEYTGMINKKADPQIWSVDILETNAFYEASENSINIVPGFFCDATYRSDMSLEEKYGALGSVIGHEISHAFDTSGAQYDADGNVANWWTDEDKAAFDARAQKQADYYDEIVLLEDGTRCNGKMVQTEAIADMGGFKAMLKMAEKVDGFDYDRFFRTYARLWSRLLTRENCEWRIREDPHPLAYLRVNITVAQFDEFYETYGVKEGDGMYVAEEDRVAVW